MEGGSLCCVGLTVCECVCVCGRRRGGGREGGHERELMACIYFGSLMPHLFHKPVFVRPVKMSVV